MQKKKWVHVTGIVGVATAPIANMFKEMGWFVTGSDKGFWPPMSTYVNKKKIPLMVGYKAKHLKKETYKKILDLKGIMVDSKPDLLVVSGFMSLKNPEFLEAKKRNIPIKSYAEVLEEYVVKNNSVVVTGTMGKTTMTSLLVELFEKGGKDPSYMIGGLAIGRENGAKRTKSEWSIIEGDEYLASRWVNKSKFFYYHPKYLLIIAAAHEHTDVFPTEEEYINNFKKLVSEVPEDGLIIASLRGKNVKEITEDAKCKVLFYELNKIDEVTANASWFNLPHKKDKKYNYIFNQERDLEIQVEHNLIGYHNLENIIGAVALAYEAGIDISSIQESLKNFKGVKRRLEIKAKINGITIIDDIACSPPKVKGSLEALRLEYPKNEYNIKVLFEPNIGNRTTESVPLYEKSFNLADEVIIPRLSMAKSRKDEEWLSGKDVEEIIKNDVKKTKYIPDDDELVKYLANSSRNKDVIVFMGSHGFRKMIEETIIRLKKQR